MGSFLQTREEWAELAVKGILSGRERRAARQELLDHIDDHTEALMAAGRSADQPSREAVAAMGDPEQTAALLRAAHQPILTWALRVCRVVALLLAVTLVFWLDSSWWRNISQRDTIEDLRVDILSDDLELGPGESHRLFLPEDAPTMELRDYRLVLDRAGIHHMMDDGQRRSDLELLFAVEGCDPLKDELQLPQQVILRDDMGHSFARYYVEGHDNQLFSHRDYRCWKVSVIYWDSDRREPQWVELDYTVEGKTFTQRFDLNWEVQP